jgi:hypothetical protein
VLAEVTYSRSVFWSFFSWHVPWCQSETSRAPFQLRRFRLSKYMQSSAINTPQYKAFCILKKLYLFQTQETSYKRNLPSDFLTPFQPVLDVYEVHPAWPLTRLHTSSGGTYTLRSGAAPALPVLNTVQVYVPCTFHYIFTRVFCFICLKRKTLISV